MLIVQGGHYAKVKCLQASIACVSHLSVEPSAGVFLLLLSLIGICRARHLVDGIQGHSELAHPTGTIPTPRHNVHLALSTVILGNTLTAAKAFSALLFSILRFPLFQLPSILQQCRCEALQ
jgi:hypothetical protein